MTRVEPGPVPVAPPAALPLLPYADLPARWGVAVERSPTSVRVVVPPVPGWRHLHKGFFIGFAAFGALLLAETASKWNVAGPQALWSALMSYGTALAFGVALAVQRLRRRTIIEVSDKMVSVRFLPSRRPTRYMSWPRDAVSEIRLNPFDDMLLIRVTGVDLVEVYLSPNREVNEAVAGMLAEALKSTESRRSGVEGL